MSETKLDENFPEGQFLMDGFTPPYRMDKNTNRGGIVLYVREDVPSRQISFKNDDEDIEHFFGQPPQEFHIHISLTYSS